MTQALEATVPVAHAARRTRVAVPPVGWSAIGVGVVLLAWQVIATAWLERLHILPSPTSIAAAVIEAYPVLAANVPVTLSTAGLGYAWGAGLAIAAGMVAVLAKPIEHVAVRTAIIADSLPTIALAPILMIVASGNTPGVVMAAISVFFLTLMSFVAGLGQASPLALEMNRAFGGGRLSELFGIRLRYAFPSLMSGLMLSAPAALVGALMSEFLVMGRGLGGALIAAQEQLATDRVWAISIVCALLSGAAFAILATARRRLAPWVSEQTQEYRASVRSRRRMLSAVQAVAVALVSLLVVVGLWYGGIALFHLNSYFAKTPVDVVGYLFGSADAAAHRAEIAGYLGSTFLKALLGLVLGTILALLAAWCSISFAPARAAIMPLIVGFRAVPLLALIPVVSLLVGNGYATAVIVAAIMSFFTTAINVTQAAGGVPRDIIHLGEAYNARPMAFRWKVHRFYVTPAVFTSLKITVPAALIGAMSAEWLATGDGIGHLMIQAAMESRYLTMWSSFVVLTVLSVALYTMVTVIERLVLRRIQ